MCALRDKAEATARIHQGLTLKSNGLLRHLTISTTYIHLRANTVSFSEFIRPTMCGLDSNNGKDGRNYTAMRSSALRNPGLGHPSQGD